MFYVSELKQHARSIFILFFICLLVTFFQSSPLTSIVGLFITAPLQLAIMKQTPLKFVELLAGILSKKPLLYAFTYLAGMLPAALMMGLLSNLLKIQSGEWVIVPVVAIIHAVLAPFFYGLATGKKGVSLRVSDYIVFILIMVVFQGIDQAGDMLHERYYLLGLAIKSVVTFTFVLAECLKSIIILRRNLLAKDSAV